MSRGSMSITQLIELKEEAKAAEKHAVDIWHQLRVSCHHPEEVQRRRRSQDELPVLKTCDICGFEEYII